MGKIAIVLFLVAALLVTGACGNIQEPNQTSNIGMASPSDAPDAAPENFFSFLDFERAANGEWSDQYYFVRDKTSYNDYEKIEKGMKLDRIIVYKTGISILYTMDNPDQKFITTLEENNVMQAKKIAETFEIKTFINESSDGNPRPAAENYNVETKGNQTYYYTEIITNGQIRANWIIGYVSAPDFVEVIIPGNYDFDGAIELAKTVKKKIPKIEIEEKYKRKGTEQIESTADSVGNSTQGSSTTERGEMCFGYETKDFKAYYRPGN